MKIAIIGNGISGITAARYIRKLSDHEITVISAESDYFFSRTALMYVYMGHMKFKEIQPYENWFWEKNRIQLKNGYVNNINYDSKVLKLEGGEELNYNKLILAVGSTPNKFGWPGQDLDRVYGMYTKQDLEAMEKYSLGLQRAVIVGGGLIGLEMAEMFHSRHIPVSILVREDSYWNGVMPAEESQIINRHIKEHHLDLQLNTELKEIVDDGNGNACAVITNKGERIECGFVGLTAGVRPNVNFLKDTGINIKKGIVVNKYLETNKPDVYAIGDCAQISEPCEGRRPIEAVWYTGKMMGETVAYTICKQKQAYDPGIWFNSAKFLDIEYQVYGNVLANPPENHQSLYWEAENGKKSIRIVYDKNDKTIIGFNLMGVRYRHEVCEKWIADKASIEEVLKNLSLANFDPEMFKQYESDVISLYNSQNGTSLKLEKTSAWNNVFSFLKS